MPAIQRSEFALALNQVATERGVDITVVLDTVKNAILAAYRKDHPGIEVEEYAAELNPNTGEAHILHNGKDVTPPGFGRIAAQTAKQVILQKIREKEKEAIFSDYRTRIGSVVNGMVLRFLGSNVIVDIGKTEAVMPPQDQISQEKYRLNQRLSVYIVDIREGMRGEEIIVSRAHNGLLEGLFKREVPEVAQGSVVIKAIVREPGNRAKVAVASNQSGIDPVGSCVGQKGVRIQAIIQEFNGLEKIDIIQWSEDPTTYIANALSPAKSVRVELNEEEKVAHVFVPQDQLSLTIGGGGQNVRLASKLTEYRIEVEGEGGPADGEGQSAEGKVSEETKDEVSKETAVSAESSSEPKPASAEATEGKEGVSEEVKEVAKETNETKEPEIASTGSEETVDKIAGKSEEDIAEDAEDTQKANSKSQIANSPSEVSDEHNAQAATSTEESKEVTGTDQAKQVEEASDTEEKKEKS